MSFGFICPESQVNSEHFFEFGAGCQGSKFKKRPEELDYQVESQS
jgi:hypothetical protein